MKLTKEWEKKAPACEECKKKDNWNAFVENMVTGAKYFVCGCGHEQDYVEGRK